MFGADKGKADRRRMNGKKLKIGIVQARFNESVTDALAQACKPSCWPWVWPRRTSTCITVPGALEVPVALQALAEKATELRRAGGAGLHHPRRNLPL
jgi:6,7-dimethyl-8-ribityllumazine synthase